jgi:ABC-2 type transport system permease protein
VDVASDRTAAVKDGGRPVGIARVLVRLKWRLLLNRIRSSAAGSVGLVVGAIGGLLGGVGGFALFVVVGFGGSADDRRHVLVLGANALVLVWALLPLATIGNDETLDPARLVLYPLRRWPLVRGQIAASLVGIAPSATVVALLGVVIGFGGGGAFLISLPAVVLAVLLAVVTSRTLATGFAAALTTRKARDAAVVLASLVFVAFQALRFVELPGVSNVQVDRFTDTLRWTPPGMLGQAVADAGRGRWLPALAGLVPAALLVAGLCWLWARLLERSLTVVTGGSSAPARERRQVAPRRRPTLYPRWVAWMPLTVVGAVAARELRYAWREPRRKAALLTRTILAIGGPVWVATQVGHPRPLVVLGAAAVGYLTVLGAFNQFGFDGAALASDVVAGNRMDALIRGKNLALLVLSVPPVVVCAFLLAAAADGWTLVPAALLLSVASIGAGLGVANVTSVRLPQKVASSPNGLGGGMFGNGGGGGQGCVTSLTLSVALVVQVVVAAPPAVAVLIAATHSSIAALVVAPFAAAYGYGAWRVGVKVAVDWSWWREPEILAAVDPTRSG